MLIRTTACASLVLSCLLAGGCHHDKKPMDSTMTSMQSKPLWDRLGGEPAVTAVVHDLVQRAAADPKVNFTRQGHPNHWDPTPDNVAHLEKHLVQFIAANTGGPKEYAGNDMTTVHKGMEISEAEFTAFAGDLKATLDQFKVPAAEQSELMTIIGSTHDQIVGK